MNRDIENNIMIVLNDLFKQQNVDLLNLISQECSDEKDKNNFIKKYNKESKRFLNIKKDNEISFYNRIISNRVKKI